MTKYLQGQTLYPKLIDQPINENVSMIIVIPAFDEPDIIGTLESLRNCEKTKHPIEVIVAINYGEQVDENLKSKSNKQHVEVLDWMENNNTEHLKMYCILLNELPKKHAGVGLARKIAMDEAVRRFEEINENGVLICLDADCRISKNYLTYIENHYEENEKCIAANVDFEHPIENEKVDSAIILYELFLRYYIEGLRFSNYHYAFHTIGSTITVKSKTYQLQGGMNKRKAGEDFYFLHKIFPLGNFDEIKNATVYPSARTSNRVPFGTGRAILEWQMGKKDLSLSYDIRVFQMLKKLFNSFEQTFTAKGVEELNLCIELTAYLKKIDYQAVIEEIRKNTADETSFKKRLKRYWDGFNVLKLVHYLRDEHFKNQDLIKMAAELYEQKYKVIIEDKSALSLLLHYRHIQKKRSD